MDRPKISLIITTYNRDVYLGTAIQSALSQGYRNLELLVFNDGSTDNTMEVINGWAFHDTRLAWVASDHVGRVEALAQSHHLITGDYVGWLDDDDFLDRDALVQCMTAMESGAYEMVYTDRYYVGPNGEMKGRNKPHVYTFEALKRQFITKHFRLYSRAVYDEIGGLNAQYDCAFDYDFCLRMGARHGIFHLPKPLYYYRRHPGQISQTRQAEQDRNCRLIRRRFLDSQDEGPTR